MAKDPFTLVYEAIWRMLESHREFAKKVKVSNRGIYTSRGRWDPRNLENLPADRPCVLLLPEGADPHLGRTSNSSSMLLRYLLIVVTDSLLINEDLYPIVWELYRAMLLWDTKLRTLDYEGANPVKKSTPRRLVTTLVDAEQRGIKGWVGRWDYEVECFFSTAAIKPS